MLGILLFLVSALLFVAVVIWHSRMPMPGSAYQRVVVSPLEIAVAIPAIIAVGIGGYLLFAQRGSASFIGMSLALVILAFGVGLIAWLRTRWQSRV